MSISPARRIAFDVLRRVCGEGAYASELLYSQLGPRVGRADAALATEITLGTLRWQRLLDFLLELHLDRDPERLDLEVRIALRVGLYQLRFLERVPPHAAVSESVELVKRAKKRSAAALVNAVLRRAMPEAKIAGGALEKKLPAGASASERLGILHSHPTWMVERWLARYGEQRSIALLDANNRPPRLCCAVLGEKTERMQTALRNEGVEAGPGRWLRSALTISGGNPANADELREGRISLQDEASQMVALLADVRAGQRVLDLCAAPGGKTILMAREAGASGRIIACDLHVHRLRAIAGQLKRTGTGNVEILRIDATRALPFRQSFQKVLVDAPCSGTGTLARNPEIRWRLSEDDLAQAHRTQVAMLGNALEVLAPGGRLVYSTCSMETEENEQVVAEVLAGNPATRVVDGRAALASHLRPGVAIDELFDTQGVFRTFPPETGTDGFFAAVLERQDSR